MPGPASPLVNRLALAGWAVAAALLVSGTLVHVARLELDGPSTAGRFREELNIAAVRLATGRYPAATYRITPAFVSRDPRAAAFQAAVAQESRREGIRPWQFWRTVALAPLPIDTAYPVLVTDDQGRLLLLTAASAVLGGLAPFLVFWLGLLVLLPLTAWAAWELHRAGHGPAGIVFLLLLGSSPFVVEALALAYSAVGFQVAGLVILVALAAHAVLHPAPTTQSLGLRVLAAALALAVCLACRRGTLLLAPGFVAAVAIGAWRVAGRRVVPAAATAGGLMLLLVLPPAATLAALARLQQADGRVAPKARHQPWFLLWEGLGDFDREKGYSWSDRKAMQYAIDAGGPMRALGPQSEQAFRDKVLRDIREDPAWYAAILVRRAGATLLQARLWPRGGAESFAPATTFNEGVMDSYYRLVTTVDHLGVGPWRIEVPVALLWGPTFAWGAWALVRRRGARQALCLACLAVAAGTVPVLISTASAIEPQSFVLVYFLGSGFALEALLRRSTPVTRSASSAS